jgi:uncharacterized protein YkwD
MSKRDLAPSPSSPTTRQRWRTRLSLAVAAGALAGSAGAFPAGTGAVDAQTVVSNPEDWLGAVNAYRSMSGLNPVSSNAAWSNGAYEHSCYMVRNGIISHYQDSKLPGATPSGANAGMKGNVAVSSSAEASARSHVDLWMTGPFHAIGILRPELTQVGFGKCSDPNASRWRSGATLNILDGLNGPRGPRPVVFPGPGSTVPLNRFVVESPDPVALCGWSGPAGLPLIAMLPASVSSATATLRGPNGPEQVCVLHGANTSEPTAKWIMSNDNAVVIVPRNPMATGSWSASVRSDGGNVDWSFNVDPNAPLTSGGPPPPHTGTSDVVIGNTAGGYDGVSPFRLVDTRHGKGGVRLRARTTSTFTLPGSPGDTVAVALNATAVNSNGPGFVTLFDCSSAVPNASTLNYVGAGAVANGALIPVSNQRTICAYAHTDVDLVIDVNGWVTASSTSGFTAVSPSRILDTRSGGSRIQPNRTMRIPVAGRAGVPASAAAVVLNVTAVNSDRAGFLSVWPCGGSRPEVSNLNVSAGETRGNNVTVSLSGGDICVEGMIGADLVIDVSGYHAVGGTKITPVSPTRLADTRDANPVLQAGLGGRPARDREVVRLTVAGSRGIPADTRAVALNVTAVSPDGDGFVTVWPCSAGIPEVSTLNYRAGGPPVPNGALVSLSPTGGLCLFSHRGAHLIVDVNAIVR